MVNLITDKRKQVLIDFLKEANKPPRNSLNIKGTVITIDRCGYNEDLRDGPANDIRANVRMENAHGRFRIDDVLFTDNGFVITIKSTRGIEKERLSSFNIMGFLNDNHKVILDKLLLPLLKNDGKIRGIREGKESTTSDVEWKGPPIPDFVDPNNPDFVGVGNIYFSDDKEGTK
ncbi:MAG: hypothetical protein GY928_34150 [Colwellia sp.]|nr:hypothetical protein [Colwellia sp.]